MSISGKKRKLEEQESTSPPLKQQKCDENNKEEDDDIIEEYTMKCDIVQDYIREQETKQHDNHALILSNTYRNACKISQPLITEITKQILKYSVLSTLFQTKWCDNKEYKGNGIKLNKTKLSMYTSTCDINESCRCQDPFPNGKKSMIKFKYYRNDECCFTASFIGLHKKTTRRISYSTSPCAPDGYGMYQGPINKISYGLLECGAWIDPKIKINNLNYNDPSFGDQDIITLECDFRDNKNKKLLIYINECSKPFEKRLPYFGDNDEWFAAVGFGSGES